MIRVGEEERFEREMAEGGVVPGRSRLKLRLRLRIVSDEDECGAGI
jgi:hypothetical protein